MTSRESFSRIVQLARTISESVDKIEEVLVAEGIESPSFDEDATFNIPLKLSPQHDAVLDATAELHDLLLEPLNLIHRHGGDIARDTPLTTDMTARLLRHAMTMRIFRETSPGIVAHTAASRTLHKSAANDWLQAGTTEMWPAAVKTIDALKKWPASGEPNETGYSLANDTSETIYQIFSKDMERASRWARGMQIFAERPQFSLAYTTDYYDWESLGKAHVVDVGGSSGHVSLALARKFSNLSLTVQDMEQLVANATVPGDVQGRVKFMAHDIFSPQPVKNADVYYLRWILHNWSDKYCNLILNALLPALKPGARVIIHESLIPEPGTTAMWKEKNLRATDLNMAGAFNAKERTKVEYESLFKKVDPAFTLRNVVEPKGSALQMVEFLWEGTT
ncbi:putative Sterigmatocystin 8-O-methyltransferase [Paraphaeosphaeria sporulosa]|uniref:Putative Sterigmatocystin 8-O-methyltransferase n=1 Tax=Paraphaeosphaeria sporulosa TaxID=1460663 RepID=A0A177C2K1_9PLEO|nr:putative Sterigmatocystin 8-O-methyltransferase [Paraphaeosphaeria sporulosa]OAG01873.1 putative Sterigmatocystin 8-O-methyltransferase [Paraphaeosphaeria sporulosa]